MSSKRLGARNLFRRTSALLILCANVLILIFVSLFGHAAEWYVAPGGTGTGTLASPGSLSNGLARVNWATNLVAGDTVWLRGGVHQGAGADTNVFIVAVAGSAGNLITWRNYPGEKPKVDGIFLYGTFGYHRFIGIEFYDSLKANVYWFDSASRSRLWADDSGARGNELLNCYIHDIGMGPSASFIAVRGCVIIFPGQNLQDHVIYPGIAEMNVSGNIVGWSASTVEIGAVGMSFRSNIFFGMGETMTTVDGRELMISSTISNVSITDNVFFLRDQFMRAIDVNHPSAIVADNVITAFTPLRFGGAGGVITNNVVYHNYSDAYHVLVRTATTGTWTINSNQYFAVGTVKFDDATTERTFGGWTSTYPAFDTTSTSANTTEPPDLVRVYPNADEPKRAHVAIYNWSGAHNVSVSLAGVLNAGDAYQLISAQNYGAGVIRYGIYNGSNISVPMTNLSAAAILYGTNVAVTVSLTSPDFGAFVLIGGETETVGVATVTTVNAGSITLSPP